MPIFIKATKKALNAVNKYTEEVLKTTFVNPIKKINFTNLTEESEENLKELIELYFT